MPAITTTQEITVDIDIYCEKCGRDLYRETSVNSRSGSITIEPCPDCIKELEDKIDELKSK